MYLQYIRRVTVPITVGTRRMWKYTVSLHTSKETELQGNNVSHILVAFGSNYNIRSLFLSTYIRDFLSESSEMWQLT